MRFRAQFSYKVGLLIVVSAALVIATAACGPTAAPSGSSQGSANAKEFQDRLNELYEGTYTKPAGPPIKPKAGKKVWNVTAGNTSEAVRNQARAIKHAGERIGWQVTTFDSKFRPDLMVAGIEQAIADQTDGIIVTYIDCPLMKAALQRANKAGVPVVATESSDCGDLREGDPQLFDWVVRNAGGQPFREWTQDWGAAQATWVIAKTNGEANTILTVETDLETTRLAGEAAQREFERCGSCAVEVLKFSNEDLGPGLQQKIEQSLIKNPDANSFIASFDAVLTLGGASALKASGRDLAIMGGEGSQPGIQLIHEDRGSDACVGIPMEWEGYAAVDALIRVLEHQDPADTDTGIGIQICDREHNLPPKGEGYGSPIDFEAEYLTLWGVQ